MFAMQSYTLLAISGSLRAGSSNTALLEAAKTLVPTGMTLELYAGLGDLPHYNPDREDEPIPVVDDLRARVRAAHGLVICSPEYARGVPGALKNALDWLVGGIEIVRKPVALINASPYSVHAHAALTLILETMSAHVVPAASITVPLRGRKLSASEIAGDALIGDQLRAALAALAQAMAEVRPPSG
jgi:chromate reductase, NAD(P)H dehydrogenase (quinone)